MKKIIQFISILFFLFSSHFCFGQDSLKLADMHQFTYSFNLINGELIGEGASILTKAIGNAHVTMLGDNVRSKSESELTIALLEELDKSGYKNMVLETGYGSNRTLDKLANSPKTIITDLKVINQQYALGKRESLMTPIPDFKSVEAAEFTQLGAEKDWSFFAIGTDSWTAYQLLLDELFSNLSKANQLAYDSLYQVSSSLLQQAYSKVAKQDNEQVKAFIKTIKADNAFTNFLTAMSTFDKNKEVLDAIQFSLFYWELYGQRDFYTKNKRQAKRNKRLLAQQLEHQEFDFKKDKLFIKMWVSHLAKGTTVSGFYGVGNMLQEMTAYHGNSSITIAIARRFYEENGEVKDILDSGNPYLNFKELIPLGEKEAWTLVDLRPFNKAFYWEGVQMSVTMHKILARYDFLVIPKTDSNGTTNY